MLFIIIHGKVTNIKYINLCVLKYSLADFYANTASSAKQM